MKNVIGESDKLFITSYQLNGTSIKINYGKNRFRVIPYSKEAENIILEIMKKQVETMYDFENIITSDYKTCRNFAIIDAFLALANGAMFLFNHTNNIKYINLAGMIVTDAAAIIYAGQANKNHKKLDEIRKYKYFLENEDIINHEITLRYFDFYGKDADINEANRITLNNIDDYTLEDLETIVELIKSSDEYKLEHKRA
jgi:hypothetical protein